MWRRSHLALANALGAYKVTVLLQLKSAQFSGGQVVDCDPNGITTLVGPNNSGKTSTLREIYSAIRYNETGPVLTSVNVEMLGSIDDLDNGFATTSK
jgi:ABC-type branched-subunit amino acid transport system ATPase component